MEYKNLHQYIIKECANKFFCDECPPNSHEIYIHSIFMIISVVLISFLLAWPI